MTNERKAYRKFIQALADTAGISISGLARRAGIASSTLNRFMSKDDVKHVLSMTTINKVSEAAGLSPEAAYRLLAEIRLAVDNDRHPADAEPIPMPERFLRGRRVPIVGYVGGGAEVYYPDGEAWPIDEVEVPGAGEDAEAVILRGDSMAPAYRDRDLIVYRRATASPRDLLGEECVVRVADGRTFIKTLMPGSAPALFTLVSHNPTMPPIVDVPIDWAVPVVMRISGRHKF